MTEKSTYKSNLTVAILISAIAHLMLLWALSHWQKPQPVHKTPSKAVVDAKLLFLPKPKKEEAIIETKQETVTEVEEKPATEPTQKQPAKKQVKPTSEPVKVQFKAPVELQSQSQKKPQANLPTQSDGSYNPYAGIRSLLEEKDQQMFDSVSIEDQPKPSIKSINSSDDPVVKPIYKTEQQISPTTRVINYHGKCVQIERKIDHNGFSYNQWSGTNIDCGQGDAMKKQLKLSLEKFTKPKKLE